MKKKNTICNDYLEVGDALADLLNLSGAFKAEDERSLGRGVDGALSDDQVLEVQAAVTKENIS